MPVEPSQSTVQIAPTPAPAVPEVTTKSAPESGKPSPFGPDYVLGNEKAKVVTEPNPIERRPQSYTIPFISPDSPSRTLASLPPLEPLGAAKLTELSLQKILATPEPKG